MSRTFEEMLPQLSPALRAVEIDNHYPAFNVCAFLTRLQCKEHLVRLTLSNIPELEILSIPNNCLGYVEHLKLECNRYLTRVDGFQHVGKLKTLSFMGCCRLEEVDCSALESLESFSLNCCVELKTIIGLDKANKSLKNLNLRRTLQYAGEDRDELLFIKGRFGNLMSLNLGGLGLLPILKEQRFLDWTENRPFLWVVADAQCRWEYGMGFELKPKREADWSKFGGDPAFLVDIAIDEPYAVDLAANICSFSHTELHKTVESMSSCETREDVGKIIEALELDVHLRKAVHNKLLTCTTGKERRGVYGYSNASFLEYLYYCARNREEMVRAVAPVVQEHKRQIQADLKYYEDARALGFY
mmetsp:Transcript_22997/g.36633  ORF Transcript_22997/g.36633 Transcript_22997/m.36633 type:complete len:358 (-) Transcript_22997:119-1192(-)